MNSKLNFDTIKRPPQPLSSATLNEGTHSNTASPLELSPMPQYKIKVEEPKILDSFKLASIATSRNPDKKLMKKTSSIV